MSSDLNRVIETAGEILLGKTQVIKLSLACLLARGHLLIEGLPGVGKTTLAHLLGLHYQRIQFTSDMLPSDIIGVSVYQQKDQRFQFHPGPVFAQLVLADEINRATPKAQSALLEAMEERQVTADGQTHGSARTLLRHRHPEPAPSDWHLSPAGIPARPIPHAYPDRLSRAGC